jgi:ABC-type sugar transport system ATPase subunit
LAGFRTILASRVDVPKCKTVILISHNLSQVFEVADQVSVMFHGEMAGTRRMKETTREEIVSMIVGVKTDELAMA